MKLISIIGISILTIIILFGLTWAVQGNEFFLMKVFAPRMEQVRREVFEQSKAYNDGMVKELQAMQFQYFQAGEVHKEALASLILHRAAGFPEERLTHDLHAFIADLKRQQGGQ